MKANIEEFDLIIIGGGISATLLCLSIYKRDPEFKILIIEKSTEFPHKIGESVIDLTAVFFKSLNIEHLLKEQTNKAGVRFLFNESNSSDLADVAEFASPTLPGVVKGYHLNRSVFDQKLLGEVTKKGATVFRPATIIKSSFQEFNNQLAISIEGEIKNVQSKWVVDATGRARYIPNQLNWKDKERDLNTGAIMAHFKNIAPNSTWDTKANDYWETCSIGLRQFSTTHLMRKNCWWWIIRIDEKITSIGVVFDKNKIEFDNPEQFFHSQLENDAQLSVMTKEAEIGKINHIENLAYVSEQLYSKGVALIGESGAFLDPFISPGLEMIGQQTIWLSELLIADKKKGVFNENDWKKYSQVFYKSYDARLTIYKAAYSFMHSYDLFTIWLKQGNFAYFSKVVFPSIISQKQIKYPLIFNKLEQLAVKYFKFRLTKISNKRLKQGRQSNYPKNEVSYSSVRVPKKVFFPIVSIHLLGKSLWSYFLLEIKEWYYSIAKR